MAAGLPGRKCQDNEILARYATYSSKASGGVACLGLTVQPRMACSTCQSAGSSFSCATDFLLLAALASLMNSMEGNSV